MQENGILSTGIEAKQSNSPKEELSSEEEDNGQSEDDELDNGHNLKHQGDELSRARKVTRVKYLYLLLRYQNVHLKK